MRRSRVVTGIIGSLVLLSAGLIVPAVASTESPIVGTWTHSGGGVIEVVASGDSSYIGTVTKAVNFGSCSHPVGERIWSLQDTQYPNEFTGTHVMCNGSAGSARILLDDVDNAATPTIRLDLYANGTRVGELTRPGRVTMPAATPTPTATPTPSASPSATPQTPPTIILRAPNSIFRQTSGGWVTVPLRVRISGLKDEWLNWQIDIHDNTGRVFMAKTDQFRGESGTGYMDFRFRPAATYGGGPFYACAWGRTEFGETPTVNAPRSSCAFLRIQQAAPMWMDSRTCAPGYATEDTDWMTGFQVYGGKFVPFWRACAIRDAGYQGLTVREPRTGTWYDFREWSRSEIDALFLKLLQQECRVALRRAPAASMRACMGGVGSSGVDPGGSYGANTYYTATRALGAPFFDVNLTYPGTQSTPDYSAVPSGGQRTND